MAFPLSPVNGELYTNALGTQYIYVQADTAWKIVNGGGGGTVKGTGTATYLAKFSDSTTIADSPFFTQGTQLCELSTKRVVGTDGSNLFMGGGGANLATTGDNEEASFNTALGINAMTGIDRGKANVAIGYGAGTSIDSGSNNTAVGAGALTGGGAGCGFNTSIGASSSSAINAGLHNTVVGNVAMAYNMDGDSNTILGSSAGVYNYDTEDTTQMTSLSHCTHVGYKTRSGEAAASATGEIIIGSNAVGLGSNTAVIGTATQSKMCVFGNLGIDNTSPLGIFHPIQDSTGMGTCMAGNVGPTIAIAGTFTRDSTASPPMCREDAGVLTGDSGTSGELEILGFDTTNGDKFCGTGYIWSTGGVGSQSIISSCFNFQGGYVSLFGTYGGPISVSDDTTSLCILAYPSQSTKSQTLTIKNNLEIDVNMGYWIKYWRYLGA